MCKACYEESGSPKIINDKTRKASELIKAVYEFNLVGGNCHLVLDDFNLEDSAIDWCLKEGITSNVHEHNAEQLKTEVECLLFLKTLTLDERTSAMAMYRNWI